nr:hypothetical protein [Tanacetum cinerariifolium]
RTLSRIQALLNDARNKEITNEAVHEWLNGLQHLAYDIDDILDDLATEAMHNESTEESRVSTSKIRKLIPACCTKFSLSTRLSPQLDNITTKLQDLEKQKESIGLEVKNGSLQVKDDRPKDKNRVLETSLVDASSIVGRKDDKDELIDKLLGDDPSNKNFSIVPIVGMGGLFAYCSLFPKDYLFNKDDLVLLWMAEGFLHQSDPSKSNEEHLGHDYFEELLSRSFFSHAPHDESLFVMHDLMHDLATSIAGKFFSGVKERRRRYYLPVKVLVDLLPELQFLRVLSLSGYEISEVPESIGILKHLRYLNLSQTKITHLPDTVCDLYHLETLILFGCSLLTKLPNDFIKLKSLRHLDITDTPLLKDLPLWVSELKSLQTLSKIIIGGENSFSINNLKDFRNLHGKVSIKGLDKVKNATEAREANLSQKMLTKLEMEWTDVSDGSREETSDEEVLDMLKPDNDGLKKLEIVNYGRLKFPKWVGDPLFRQLAHVSIRGCKKCTSFPPLGELPALKELSIQDMDDVKDVGLEFLGTGVAFPSLEILKFKGMPGWEVWSTNSRSEVLKIKECGNGVLSSLVYGAPSVTKLEIVSISGLTNEVWRGVILDLEAVEELVVTQCHEVRYLWESEVAEASSKVLVKLRILFVSNCKNLVSLWEKDEEYNYGSNLLTSLTLLYMHGCENFKHLSGPNNIETLQINYCGSMKCVSFSRGGGQKLKSVDTGNCSEKLMMKSWEKTERRIGYLSTAKAYMQLPSLTSLTTLRIWNCPSMDVPTAGLWPPNLRVLDIGKLKKPISEWGPQMNFPTSLIWSFDNLEKGLQHLTSLQHLTIINCPKVKDLPETLLPSPLSLYIFGCPVLKERCSKRGGSYCPQTYLDVVACEVGHFFKCPTSQATTFVS